MLNTMHWHSIPVDAHRTLGNFLIKLIDNRIDLLFEGLKFLLIFWFHFLGLGVNKKLHICGVLEIQRLNLPFLVLLVEVALLWLDGDLGFPVFFIHRDQEVLEIVHLCCVLGHVPLIDCFFRLVVFDREVTLDVLIECLILVQKLSDLVGHFLTFLLIFTDWALDLGKQLGWEITHEHTFDTFIHEFEHDLKAMVNLFTGLEENLLVDRVSGQLA